LKRGREGGESSDQKGGDRGLMSKKIALSRITVKVEEKKKILRVTNKEEENVGNRTLWGRRKGNVLRERRRKKNN